MLIANLANEELMNELISYHKSVTDRYHFCCFTDGSCIKNKTGSALVVYSMHNADPLATFKWRLFQAEMMTYKRSLHMPALPALSELISSYLHRLTFRSSRSIC